MIDFETETVKAVICVAGNHELSFQGNAKHAVVRERQKAMKQKLMDTPNLYYLEDSECDVFGLRFYGSPWTLPVNGGMTWAFQQHRSEIKKSFDKIPEGIDVLVTHQPPIGDRSHPGSEALLNRVKEIKPKLHVFGHYHEGHGIQDIEGVETLCVNAAICDKHYKPIQQPIFVEFD